MDNYDIAALIGIVGMPLAFIIIASVINILVQWLMVLMKTLNPSDKE